MPSSTCRFLSLATCVILAASLPAWEDPPGPNAELQKFQGSRSYMVAASVSPDGKLALTGSKDGILILWDCESGMEVRRLTGPATEPLRVVFSADGKRVAVASKDGSLSVIDAQTGKQVQKFPGHRDPALAVMFLPDGKRVVSGAGGVDDTIRVWNIDTGKEMTQVRFAKSANIYALAFSNDARWALTGHASDVKLWETATGKDVATLEGHNTRVTSVAFSRDVKTGVSGSKDKTARIWDLTTGRERRTLEGHRGSVTSVAVSPDGRRVLTGSADRTVRLWDIQSGKELAVFEGHQSEVTAVAFAPDGNRALSASEDRTARLWSLPK